MAGDGDDVFGLEDGGLLEDLRRTSASVRRSVARVEILEAAGVLDGLEGDAADAGLLQGEVDDVADLVVVEALLERDDERGGDVELVEAFEGAAADVAQVFAAQLSERVASERVELQVDLEAGHVGGEALGEVCVLAMRMPLVLTIRCLIGRRLAASRISKKCGVDGGLAAGDLDDVGLAFVADDAVEHELDLLERAVRRCGAGRTRA